MRPRKLSWGALRGERSRDGACRASKCECVSTASRVREHQREDEGKGLVEVSVHAWNRRDGGSRKDETIRWVKLVDEAMHTMEMRAYNTRRRRK